MDSEILKVICANQGAVDADVLMFNLFPGASANEVVSNKNNWVLCRWNGQQRVVGRTGLKLCRVKDCLGMCGLLHLCKNFLFSGVCSRRICSFCHDMNSGYNQWLLKQHELDHLSRAELSTLLLQSDSTLLPPICYEYNTGNDEFGQCQSGIACSRLHICKKYLSQDCRCSKTHDFYAPQPLKNLYDKGVPDTLICSLRIIYANREALRVFNRQNSAAPISANATTEVGGNLAQRHRGRERSGNKGQLRHKGNSGNRGKPHQRQQTTSCSDVLGKTDPSSQKGLSEDDNVQQELNSSSSLSAAGNDINTESADKQKVKQKHRNRGKRGGKSGDRRHKDSKVNEAILEEPLQQQKQQTASNYVHASDALDLNIEAINGDKQQQDPNSPNCDTAVGEHTDPKSDNGCHVPQNQRNQDTEKGGCRQNEAKLGNPLLQLKTASPNDVLISKGLKQDQQQQDPNSPNRDSSVAKDTNPKSNNGFSVGQNQGNQGTGINWVNAGKSLQQQQMSTLKNPLPKFASLDLLNNDKLNKVDNQQQQPASNDDRVLANNALHLNTEKGLKQDRQQQDPNSPNRDSSAFGKDTNTKSSNVFNVEQKQWNQETGVNGGNAGKSLQNALPKYASLDLFSKDGLNKASGRGYEQDSQQQLHRTCSTHVSAAASKHGNVGDVQKTKQNPVKDKTEICIYYIAGYCKDDNRCDKVHEKMPYSWQVLLDDFWTPLPQNETIEKDYCDPKNKYSSNSFPPVHFNTMTCGRNKVRRLSTPNSLVEPDLLHTTEWLWYWQDEFGKWNPYGSYTKGHGSADITSSKLEQKFLNNNKDVVDFTAGSQSYSLSFQDMTQTNTRYGTNKAVTRRPLFVSAEDVKTKTVRKPPNSTSVPDNWDKTKILLTESVKVALQPISEEYLKIAALFYSTMPKFEIIKIVRIQNKALWDAFQLQKNLMKNKNGGFDVAEKQLFHGTNPEHVDNICNENLDWRICGTHGTLYGKGSYFARDASYSHAYTGNTNVRSMFVARVLVGSFTKGAPSYLKPPSKDAINKTSYDSCVDSVVDPSIFVVFDKPQIYPEYLIQYTTTDLLGDLVTPAQPTNQCVIA